MLQVFVVIEVFIAREYRGNLMNIYRSSDAAGPPFELVQLCLREDRAFDAGDELSKRADVHTDSFTAGCNGLDEGGTAAHMGIQHQVTGFGECLDCGRR